MRFVVMGGLLAESSHSIFKKELLWSKLNLNYIEAFSSVHTKNVQRLQYREKSVVLKVLTTLYNIVW
jgi:hypothetical protein